MLLKLIDYNVIQNNMKKIIPLILAAVLSMTSCSSLTTQIEKKPNFPAMTSRTVKLKSGIDVKDNFNPPIGTIKGNTWDLGNGTLEMVGGHCDNQEKGEKVVIWKDDLVIKNGKFSHWEDGVNLRAKNVKFQNVVFENCEDAFNTGEGCEDFTITKCYFAPHPKKKSTENYQADKLIQAAVTRGNNIIEDSLFWNGICGIRVGLKKYSGSKYEGNTLIRNNKFNSISTAIHRVRGDVKLQDNQFISVKEEYKDGE